MDTSHLAGSAGSANQGTSLDAPATGLSSLFADFEDVPVLSAPEIIEVENTLAQIRLGMAGSLFLALRAHHCPTARHSLRVALVVSSWAAATDLTSEQRDELEVAALLHDVGKVGVPESILRQPSMLSPDQLAIVNKSRQHSEDILSACCVSQQIIENVRYADAWYDGSKEGFDRAGDNLPIGSRMIAIANAFDAMTVDRVYRRAMPMERAIAELYSSAGTQFDPKLIDHFAAVQSSNRTKMNQMAARRWLNELSEVDSSQFWGAQNQAPQATNEQSLFYESLLSSLPSGVVFVEANMTITRWNKSMEELTGISSQAALGRTWTPSLVSLRDHQGRFIQGDDCPVAYAITTGVFLSQAMTIKGASRKALPVEFRCVPVRGAEGSCLGATLVIRDTVSESNLEERVQTLQEKTIRDPLTGVANRAEFDRVHKESVRKNSGSHQTFSLIICDIDRFKSVNDTHGHQAGDEALVSFAALLKRRCRRGDLVARYGGEEFVMICQNCGCSEAVSMAEQIRVELSETALPELGGQSVTASFGVTELQPGDTAATMLRRADRGLLEAKDSGRNRVVQLGTGLDTAELSAGKSSWLSGLWRSKNPEANLLEKQLVTKVPLNVAVQKLRGFISDHEAEIIQVDEESINLKVTTQKRSNRRRKGDRPVTLLVNLEFITQPQDQSQETIIQVSVNANRQRDRRNQPIEAARTFLRSLMSYLMAQEYQLKPAAPAKVNP